MKNEKVGRFSQRLGRFAVEILKKER